MEEVRIFLIEHLSEWLLICVLMGTIGGVISYLVNLWDIKYGLLFRAESWWIGIHWSPYNKRFCINLIPMVTLWIAKKDGITPEQGFDIYRNDK